MELIESLRQELPADDGASSRWLIYDYDAATATRRDVIPIRDVCREYETEWLHELGLSHAVWMAHLETYDSSVWYHPLSRLDARPWGQLQTIKPLIIALGLRRWMQGHPGCTQIHCVGCPAEFFLYLAEMLQKDGIVCSTPVNSASKNYTIQSIVSCLKSFTEISRQLFHAVRESRQTPSLTAKSSQYTVWAKKRQSHLVCYDMLHGAKLSYGYRYYYTSLFDDLPNTNLMLLANGRVPESARDYMCLQKASHITHLAAIDLCNSLWKIWFALRSIWLDWIFRLLPAPVLKIDGTKCRSFWPNFRTGGLGLNFVLYAHVCRKAIKILTKARYLDSILVPYEEKGIERAIALEAANQKLELTGYAQHPQHQMAVCLKDLEGSSCPKPDKYAVCGAAYVSFLKHVCDKDNAPISVWGTAKGHVKASKVKLKKAVKPKQQPCLLLLISHPEELRIFHSWLQIKPDCIEDWKLLIRPYRAVESQVFAADLDDLQKLKCDLLVSNSSLAEDVAQSDLALFCGTSAGIEAIHLGCPAAYADLSDLFMNNPCFNSFGPIPVCRNPDDLKDLLYEIKEEEAVHATKRLLKLREYAKCLFSPIDSQEIEKSF